MVSARGSRRFNHTHFKKSPIICPKKITSFNPIIYSNYLDTGHIYMCIYICHVVVATFACIMGANVHNKFLGWRN